MSDPYWAGFETEVYFDQPGDQIVGIVEKRTSDKGTKGTAPRLGIRTEDGLLRWVTAWQARLRAELAEHKPVEGERIWIVYTGEAVDSAPGMSPSKLFKVKVDRKEPQPPERPPGRDSGEVARENVPEAGS